MKKLMFLFLLVFLFSCSSARVQKTPPAKPEYIEGTAMLKVIPPKAPIKQAKEIPYPAPPYGKPDDTSKYDTYSYQSITYVYYCYAGNYISVTYSRYRPYQGWLSWERSTYESDCIISK